MTKYTELYGTFYPIGHIMELEGKKYRVIEHVRDSRFPDIEATFGTMKLEEYIPLTRKANRAERRAMERGKKIPAARPMSGHNGMSTSAFHKR